MGGLGFKKFGPFSPWPVTGRGGPGRAGPFNSATHTLLIIIHTWDKIDPKYIGLALIDEVIEHNFGKHNYENVMFGPQLKVKIDTLSFFIFGPKSIIYLLLHFVFEFKLNQ